MSILAYRVGTLGWKKIMFYDISARAFISKHFDGNLAV